MRCILKIPVTIFYKLCSFGLWIGSVHTLQWISHFKNLHNYLFQTRLWITWCHCLMAPVDKWNIYIHFCLWHWKQRYSRKCPKALMLSRTKDKPLTPCNTEDKAASSWLRRDGVWVGVKPNNCLSCVNPITRGIKKLASLKACPDFKTRFPTKYVLNPSYKRFLSEWSSQMRWQTKMHQPCGLRKQ